jgi:ArsR family transcriptional regulator
MGCEGMDRHVRTCKEPLWGLNRAKIRHNAHHVFFRCEPWFASLVPIGASTAFLVFVGQSGGLLDKKWEPTMSKKKPAEDQALTESEEVFEKAAEVFRVMSAPMRLRIISALCNGEKNVGELLSEIETTQPNMSQHLNTLYQAGVLGKRRDGVQIYYRIVNDRVVTLCRAMCVQIASEVA